MDPDLATSTPKRANTQVQRQREH